MFSIMEDREDEININADPFGDSYTRDADIDELKEVRSPQASTSLTHADFRVQIFDKMAASKDHPIQPLEPRTRQKLESKMLGKIDAGWPAPCGWLFRGLTLFFFSPDIQTKETSVDLVLKDIRLALARNYAAFAAAETAASFDDTGITHVVVNPDTASSTEVSSLRKSIAARSGKKVARLVSCAWVEESWKNKTLLDEERKFVSRCAFSSFLPLLLFPAILCLLLVRMAYMAVSIGFLVSQ